MQFNQDKFRELVLYISEKSEGDSTFGLTKLNKLLYYCDFTAYVELGSSITGAEYRRQQFGPCPHELLPTLEQMKISNEVTIAARIYYDTEQKRPLALRAASLEHFTGEEIALVDAILQRLRDHDATTVSLLSHKDVGWQVARDGETIPYETAFVESIRRVS